MMKLCLAAAVIVASASAQKLPTPPPPPPYDGNYPPPPPRPTQDACTSDAQCPLPCPMGQSGACRPQWGAGRTCQCVSQGMPPPPPDGNYPPPPPMHPVDPIMPPAPPMHPIDPLPAPGGTSRCWTSTDGKSTQYTNGYPGSGWTLGCAPALRVKRQWGLVLQTVCSMFVRLAQIEVQPCISSLLSGSSRIGVETFGCA